MIAEYKTKSNLGVGIGIVLEIAGYALMSGDNRGIGLVILLIGGVVFLYGCFMFAMAKGYSPALGLLGFIGLIGLIILVLLPDKAKDGAVSASPPPPAPSA